MTTPLKQGHGTGAHKSDPVVRTMFEGVGSPRTATRRQFSPPVKDAPVGGTDASTGGPNQTRKGAAFNHRGPDTRARNLHGLSTDQVRILLRHNGYGVENTGGMTSRLHSAMNSYISGANVKQWNNNNPQAHLLGHNQPDPHIGPAHPAPHTAMPPAARAHPTAKGKAAPAKAKVSPLSLQGLVGMAQQAGIPIPQSVVDQIGSDYGAAVTSDKQNLGLQDKQAAQNQQDIANWFGQVLSAQGTAAGRDTAATTAGTNSVQDAVAKIVASLGGSANAGSGDVAAAGANDVGTLQAMGTAQDQYNNDIGPLLKEEAASQHTSQSARDAQMRLKLAQQLAADQGQQANEKATAQMNVDTTNSQIRQQKFGDLMGVAQENDARNALGLKAQQLMMPKPASSSSIARAASSAYGQFTIKDANGNTVANLKDAKGNPLPVTTIVQRVNNAYKASGLNLNDPTIAQSAMGVLSQLGIQANPAWYGMG